ncbi:MAG: hypothetical protein RL490_2135 [Pseudomonadota bacterium]
MTRVWLLLIALCCALPAAAGQRVALVIGIGRYDLVVSLANPPRDAALVAGALRGVGFEVTEIADARQLDRAGLAAAFRAFRTKANGTEAAVIYYAGHGVEVEGVNWLLPRDVSADSPADLKLSALPTSAAIDAVSGARLVRLVILDACRDNPFLGPGGWQGAQRGVANRGLARETQFSNAVLLLAAQPGQKAADGTGQANSPFARALAATLALPELRLATLPTRLFQAMQRSDGVQQFPDQQGIWIEPDWMFRGMPVVAAVVPPTLPPPGANQSALDVLRSKVAANDAAAQFELGRMHSLGEAGLAVDDAEAVRLYKLAAAQGYARAQNALATMYYRGQGGLAVDKAEAVRLYRLSAEQGNVFGQLYLGNMYDDGEGGLVADRAEAVRLFRLAAEQGNALGQDWLGFRYYKGVGGLAVDHVEALRLYRLSAAQGNASARFHLGNMYYAGEGGLAANKTEAIRLWNLAAKAGNALAYESLRRLGEQP